MKKILLISVAAFIFILSGCKSHITPMPVNGNVRLLKTEINYGASFTGTYYTYNADGSYSEVMNCYDPAKSDCNRSVYSYDPAGRITEVATYNNSNILRSSIINTYDASGLMISTEDTSYIFSTPNITLITYTHDAAGNTTAAVIGGFMDYSETFTYDTAGRLLCSHFQRGIYYFGTTCYTYDSADNIVRTDGTNSGGGPHAFHSIYEYDGAGKLAKVSMYDDLPGDGTLKTYTEYYYDTLGNISYELMKNADNSQISRKDYTYETIY